MDRENKSQTEDFRASDDSGAVVYFATDGENLKVGKSINPERRVKEMSVGNANNIRLINTINPDGHGMNAHELESKLHEELEPWSLTGEWFGADSIPFILGFIAGSGFDKGCDYSVKNSIGQID
jgi:hypothetical protein